MKKSKFLLLFLLIFIVSLCLSSCSLGGNNVYEINGTQLADKTYCIEIPNNDADSIDFSDYITLGKNVTYKVFYDRAQTSQLEGTVANISSIGVSYFYISFYDGKDNLIATEVVSVSIKNYSLIYFYNDTQLVISFQITNGNSIPYIPAVSEKFGYKFLGWAIDDVLVDDIETKTYESDVTYYAKFEVINYTITYNLDGGSFKDGDEIDSYTSLSDKITIPTPIKDGYYFIGWRYTGAIDPVKTIVLDAGSVGNREYRACWIKNGEYVYTVKHLKESLHNSSVFNEVEEDRQQLSGIAGEYSQAVANDYEGFIAQEPTQVVVNESGLSVASIRYLRNSYTVIFDTDDDISNGAYYSTTIKYERDVVPPQTNPTKLGYNFIGWENLVDTMPADNLVIVANFEIINYTITYTLNDCVIDGLLEEYNVETETFSISAPTKRGYRFLGWTGTEITTPVQTITINKGTTNNRTYTANFELRTDINYTVYCYFENLEDDSVFDLDSKYTEALQGSIGMSNYSARRVTGFNIKPFNQVSIEEDGSSVINIYYERAIYSAIYYYNKNAMGGITTTTQYKLKNYKYGYTIDTETPSIPGYEFDGWNNNTSVMPASTQSYYAQWTPIKYTITYNVGDGINDSKNITEYTYETQAFSLYDATIIDPLRSFLGWYTEDTFENKVTQIAGQTIGDISLYARYSIKTTYTVKHCFENLNNSNVFDEDILSRKIVDSIAFDQTNAIAISKDGFNNYNFTQEEIKEDGSTVIVINYYRVNFNINFKYGGTGSDKENIYSQYNAKYGYEIEIPATNPVKRGYTFEDWDLSYTTIQAFDVDVYPIWSLTNYSVIYVLNGGTNDKNNISTYNITTSAFTLNNPTKEGSIFAGWYTDAQFYNHITQIAGGAYRDITLYAKFNDSVDYQVHHYFQNVNDNNYTENVSLVDTLTGISGNSTKANAKDITGFTSKSFSQVTITDSSTIVNIYYDRNMYDVNYYVNSVFYNSVSFRFGATITFISGPSKTGYKFTSWGCEYSTMPATNISLSPEYTPIQYTITYYLDGGTNDASNPKKYTIESDTIILANATKDSVEFDGWYDETLENKIERIEQGSYGNVELYAKFINAKNITYIIDNLTYSELTSNAMPGDTINAPIIDSNELGMTGYSILNWYSDSTMKNVYTFTVMPENNLTLYGSWKYTAVNEGFMEYESKFASHGSSYNNACLIDSEAELIKLIDYVLYNQIKTYYYFDITYKTFATSNEYSNYVNSCYFKKEYANYPLSSGTSTADKIYGVMLCSASSVDMKSVASINTTTSQVEELDNLMGKNMIPAERSNAFDDFKINNVNKTMSVTYSDQLVYALEHGYRPIPVANSAAEKVLNQAKTILRQICNDNMTDIEKLKQIFDYMIDNVTYDYAAIDASDAAGSTNTIPFTYDAWYAEGAFRGLAVCDGISKAVVILSRLEGIPAIRVISDNHAWNRVYVDNIWYSFDATWANLKLSTSTVNYEVARYDMFLCTDQYKTNAGQTATNYLNIIANTDINFFSLYNINTSYDLFINTTSELMAVMSYYYNAFDTLNIETTYFTLCLLTDCLSSIEPLITTYCSPFRYVSSAVLSENAASPDNSVVLILILQK